MSTFIIFPHGLGDMLLLMPALRARCEESEPLSLVIQRRFNSSPFDNLGAPVITKKAVLDNSETLRI